MMKNIYQDNIPAWYEIATKNDKTLIINIHADAMNILFEKIRWNESTLVWGYQAQFSDFKTFGSFIPPKAEKPWGFGPLLVPCKSVEKDWLTYEVNIPDGKDVEWRGNAFALRSSLDILFSALCLFEEDTKCKRPQLMTIKLLVDNNHVGGGSLHARLAPAVSKWILKQQDAANFVEIQKAMFTAFSYMYKDRGFYQLYDIKVNRGKSSKFIHMDVPGNCCGLDPAPRNDLPDGGYELVPHNVDTSMQQLTLLFGLAKLHELIRKN